MEKKQPRSHKFLCLRVGKPMKKTFVSNASASMQQYAQQGKKHEYWFAVPQERSVPPESESDHTRQMCPRSRRWFCLLWTFYHFNIDSCSYAILFSV